MAPVRAKAPAKVIAKAPAKVIAKAPAKVIAKAPAKVPAKVAAKVAAKAPAKVAATKVPVKVAAKVADNPTERALAEVQRIFDEYVVFPSESARDAVVLWTLHTHAFRAFTSTPRLSLRSAEPASGKTRVLELLEHLVPNPHDAVNITPAVVWRLCEHFNPTLIIDEADTIFGRNGSSTAQQTLRGILNAGHRASGTVERVHGSEGIKTFRVFAPVAMAGLGRLPETLASRSVEIVMRPRRKGDHGVKPLELDFAEPIFRKVFSICEEWSVLLFGALRLASPDLPVQDRPADVWRPLVAIADLAGEAWGKRARAACAELVAASNERPVSIAVSLLADLRAMFDNEATVTTATLLAALLALPDTGWTADNMDARVLAKVLKRFEVAPVMLRVGAKTARGYRRVDLMDAWDRFLPDLDVTAVA